MTAAHILAHGLACPLGLRTDLAVATIRAGLKVFDESDLVLDSSGDGAVVSALSHLAPEMPRGDRMLALGSRALGEACEPLSVAQNLRTVPCFLALPRDATGTVDVSALGRGLGARVREVDPGVELDLRSEHVFVDGGRAAVFQALRAALDAFVRHESWLALVGGIDSLVDPPTLRALVEDDRLLCARNHAGLIPGEGAAFLLLARPDFAGAMSVGSIVDCVVERSTPESMVGDSLTRAFAAMRRVWSGRVDRVISGQTGQGKFERSLGCAYLRNDSLMPEPMQGLTVGAAVGDAGAAAGALALVVASAGLRPPSKSLGRRGREHHSALVYAESDDGVSGACVVSVPR